MMAMFCLSDSFLPPHGRDYVSGYPLHCQPLTAVFVSAVQKISCAYPHFFEMGLWETASLGPTLFKGAGSLWVIDKTTGRV